MKTFQVLRNIPNTDTSLLDAINRNNALLARDQSPQVLSTSKVLSGNDDIDSVQMDATSAAMTVTLPTPTGNRRRRIIKTDSSANTVTVIVSTAGQLINTSASWILSTRFAYVEVEPTGTGWIVINGFEEGTWTPSLGGNTTYTTQQGFYTKIGRQVTAQFRITVNVLGTGSTSTITGLPFTNTGAALVGYVGYWAGLAVAPAFLACYVNPSATTIVMTGVLAGAATITNAIAVYGNGADVIGTVVYFV